MWWTSHFVTLSCTSVHILFLNGEKIKLLSNLLDTLLCIAKKKKKGVISRMSWTPLDVAMLFSFIKSLSNVTKFLWYYYLMQEHTLNISINTFNHRPHGPFPLKFKTFVLQIN